MDLSHVLWIGGGPATGKSSVAEALAARFDLRLYSLDEQEAAHQPRMPAIAEGETQDGRLTASRHRFRLVLQDLAVLPPSPWAVVEGWALWPTSVAAVLRDPAHALFLLPVDRDPVSERIGWEARDLRLATLEVDGPLEQIVERAAAHFLPVLGSPS